MNVSVDSNVGSVRAGWEVAAFAAQRAAVCAAGKFAVSTARRVAVCAATGIAFMDATDLDSFADVKR